MSKPAPQLKVSPQALNVDSATKHSTQQQKTESAAAAKNANAATYKGWL